MLSYYIYSKETPELFSLFTCLRVVGGCFRSKRYLFFGVLDVFGTRRTSRSVIMVDDHYGFITLLTGLGLCLFFCEAELVYVYFS
jgi:hypothetical protein